MRIKEICVENFKCFGKFSIQIPEINNIAVIGRNLDQSGMDSNESGKTSLLDAVSWCLLSKYPEMTSADSCVHKDKTFCEVAVKFDNSIEIIRSREKNGGSLSIFVDGKELNFRTQSFAQEELLKMLGFGSKQISFAFFEFCNRVYFSPVTAKMFISSQVKSSDRIEFIRRFIGIPDINAAVGLLNDEIKEISGLISANSVVDADFVSIEQRIKMLESELSESRRTLKMVEQKLSSMADINSEMSKLEELERSVNAAEQERLSYKKIVKDEYDTIVSELKELKQEFDSKRSKLSEVDADALLARAAELEKEKDELDAEQIEIDSQISMLEKECRNLNVDLSNVDSDILNCPKCSANLILSDSSLVLADTASIERKRKAIEAELEKRRRQLVSLSKRKEVTRKKIDAVLKQAQAIGDKLAEANRLVALKQDIEYREKRCSEIEDGAKKRKRKYLQAIENFNTSLKSFEKKYAKSYDEYRRVFFSEYRKLNDKLTEISSDVRVKEKDLSDLRETLETAKLAIERKRKLETEKNVCENAKKLLGETVKASVKDFIPVLASTTNKYLKLFDAGLEVIPEINIDSIRDSFKFFVFDGSSNYLFDERSRGAQTRISIAAGFALLEIASGFGKPNDFIFCDEVVDSLDPIGVELFFDIINNSDVADIQKFIISHTDRLVKKFDSVIEIVKEGGVSIARI